MGKPSAERRKMPPGGHRALNRKAGKGNHRKRKAGGGIRWQYVFPGLGVLVLFSLFFYRSLYPVPVCLPLLYPLYKRQEGICREKSRRTLLFQFQEMTGSVMTALKAGYAAENAFREAYREMVFLFGRDSEIAEALRIIRGGLQNRVPLETLLLEFGEKSGADEILEFAEVFEIAKKSGGNLIEIMDRTAAQIRDRIEVEKEIDLLLSARKYEQRIMDVVPFLIVLYLQATSEGFFDVLYHNPAGIAVMTGCLAVYLAAFRMSEKIVDIRI